MGSFLPLVVGAAGGGGAVWLAMALPGLHRLHRQRAAKRDVAAVMAAHRVTDGPGPDTGLRRLLAAVRGRAER